MGSMGVRGSRPQPHLGFTPGWLHDFFHSLGYACFFIALNQAPLVGSILSVPLDLSSPPLNVAYSIPSYTNLIIDHYCKADL
jgi:hypothetical protein